MDETVCIGMKVREDRESINLICGNSGASFDRMYCLNEYVSLAIRAAPPVTLICESLQTDKVIVGICAKRREAVR